MFVYPTVEAEYTYRLHKDIIPLVLQPGYVPDGWLGILVGAKLYFDLSKAEVFDRELDRLMIEIGSRGKLVPVESDLVTVRTTLPCSAQRETSQSTEGQLFYSRFLLGSDGHWKILSSFEFILMNSISRGVLSVNFLPSTMTV